MPRSTPRSALTADSIVSCARRVADRDGLDQLTLRRLAAELGTGQSSLYRHIADRHELLGLLVTDLAGGYPIVSDTGLAPQAEAMAQWMALDYYLGEHPWFAVLVAGGEFRTKAALPIAENCLAQLRALGLEERDALLTYRTLWHLMVSNHMNAHPFGYFHGARNDRLEMAWAIETVLAGALARLHGSK